MKSFKDYIEEAKGPSRRDFLKGIAGAAATAASPKTALGATTNVVKQALAPVRQYHVAGFSLFPHSFTNSKTARFLVPDWGHEAWDNSEYYGENYSIMGPFKNDSHAKEYAKARGLKGFDVTDHDTAWEHSTQLTGDMGENNDFFHSYGINHPHEFANHLEQLHHDFGGDTQKVIDHLNQHFNNPIFEHEELRAYPRYALTQKFGENHPYVKVIDHHYNIQAERLGFEDFDDNYHKPPEQINDEAEPDYTEKNKQAAEKYKHPWYIDYRKGPNG